MRPWGKLSASKGSAIINTVEEKIRFLPGRSGFAGGAHPYSGGKPYKPAGWWRWAEDHCGLCLCRDGLKPFRRDGSETLGWLHLV